MTDDGFVSRELYYNIENKYGKLEYFPSYKVALNLSVYLEPKVW